MQVVEITDKAKEKLLLISKNEQLDNTDKKSVRLSIVGGGCSGLSYKIDFSQKNEADRVISLGEELEVIIDPKSSIYLKDVILDFQDGLNGKGFVFKNPKAKNTCGCGESFSV